MSSHVSVNLRYLLWRKGIQRNEWLSLITRKTGLTSMRVSLLLRGRIEDADLNSQEIGMLAEVAGIGGEPDHLRLEGLGLADCDVLRENLRYLLNSLGHGGK